MTDDLLTRGAADPGVAAALAAAVGERLSGGSAWAVRDLARPVDTLASRPELWRDVVLHRDGAEHVNDVISERTEPPVSIHAGSRPLHPVTSSAQDGDGVRPVRTEDVTNRVPA